MFLILTVLAVIIADIYGENSAPQRDINTNSIRHPECYSEMVEIFKSTVTVLICVPGVESTFKMIKEKWIENPKWDDRIAHEALKEAVMRGITDADYKYYRSWLWSKAESNKTTLIQKVKSCMRIEPILDKGFFSTMYDLLSGQLDAPVRLPENIYYGCNGIFTKGVSADVMTTVCLYRKDREEKWWKVYKNVEVGSSLSTDD